MSPRSPTHLLKFSIVIQLHSGLPTSSVLAKRGFCALATVHTEYVGVSGGLHRDEQKCIGPKATEAVLWMKVWQEIEKGRCGNIQFDVKHVKADRTP